MKQIKHMKQKFCTFALSLSLILSSGVGIQAHEGHEHEDEDTNGTALISNHPLTGSWIAKSTITSHSLKFHAGHDRPAKPKVVLKLDLCGNGDTLVGTVEQIKLVDAPKKLDVDSATITDESTESTEYSVLLSSPRDSSVAIDMVTTTTDAAGEITVSFDGGETNYTATLKKSKASNRCLELLNPEQEDDSSDD